MDETSSQEDAAFKVGAFFETQCRMNVKFNRVLAYIPSRSSLDLMCLLNTDTAVTFQMLLSSLQVELTY